MAEGVLDPTQQDDVAGGLTQCRGTERRRRIGVVGQHQRVIYVQDPHLRLRVEQVQAKLERVAEGAGGVRGVVARAGSVVGDVVHLHLDHRAVVDGVDVVDHQIPVGFIDDGDVIPAALAFDQALVAPDAALRAVGGVCIGVERGIARVVEDDVVEHHLLVAGVRRCERVADALARVDPEELDVRQRLDDAVLVDVQVRVGLAQQDDVRFPEDVAGEARRFAAAFMARADVGATRTAAAAVRDAGVDGVHVQVGGAQDGLPVPFDLDVVGHLVGTVSGGRATDGVEPRLRLREVVGARVLCLDQDRLVARDLGAAVQDDPVLADDPRRGPRYCGTARGTSHGVGVRVGPVARHLRVDRDRLGQQVRTALNSDLGARELVVVGIDLVVGGAAGAFIPLQGEVVAGPEGIVGVELRCFAHLRLGVDVGADPEDAAAVGFRLGRGVVVYAVLDQQRVAGADVAIDLLIDAVIDPGFSLAVGSGAKEAAAGRLTLGRAVGLQDAFDTDVVERADHGVLADVDQARIDDGRIGLGVPDRHGTAAATVGIRDGIRVAVGLDGDVLPLQMGIRGDSEIGAQRLRGIGLSRLVAEPEAAADATCRRVHDAIGGFRNGKARSPADAGEDPGDVVDRDVEDQGLSTARAL